MATLISLLGKGQDGRGYREANYKFEDGNLVKHQKYIGLTLADKFKPEKIIFLGTTGSMWDVFLEEGSENLVEEWLQLSESVKNESVTTAQLQPFARYLSQKLNADVRCLLIPFAKNTKEQIDILSVLADNLETGESIVLDVTHGFRHLPMLALVAARFLRRTKNINTQHIYYGALDMTQNNESPILILDGLLDMLDWVDALTTFDKDGDYADFEPLLINSGLPAVEAQALSLAAFYERNINATDASAKLLHLLPKLEALSKQDGGLYGLFHSHLAKRLDWVKRGSLGLKEQNLAKTYLKRDDYLRAVIYAMEGLVSRQVEQQHGSEKVHDYDTRQAIYQALNTNKAFKLFKDFRNAMVHGSPSGKKEVTALLKNQANLVQSLRDRMNHLFDNQ